MAKMDWRNVAQHPVAVGLATGLLLALLFLVWQTHRLEEDNQEEPMNIAQLEPGQGTVALANGQRVTFHYESPPEVVAPTATPTQVASVPLATPEPVEKTPVSRVAAHTKPKEKAPTVAKAPITPKGHYTLQLLGARKEDKVQQFVKTHNLGAKAHIVRTQREGQDWYVVVYGDYANVEEAKQAKANLPGALKKSGVEPWVRTQPKEVSSEMG